MFKFCDLQFKTFLGGVQAKIHFDNGYGASVIRHGFSYGTESGLYELAVLHEDGTLCYDTPVTDDVLGYLTPDDVTRVLAQIQDLPAPAGE
jgi:hypothetical protein